MADKSAIEWTEATWNPTTGCPFFFKQWGGVHKKRAGRLLEGRIWDQMPAVSLGTSKETGAGDEKDCFARYFASVDSVLGSEYGPEIHPCKYAA